MDASNRSMRRVPLGDVDRVSWQRGRE